MRAPRSDLIGLVLNDKYRVRRRLGGGSFGDVYEAENIETQRIVALKFELGNADVKGRQSLGECQFSHRCACFCPSFGIIDFIGAFSAFSLSLQLPTVK